MIDARKAIWLSRIYLIDILSLTSSEIRLEEVELSDDGRHWFITLSFVRAMVVYNDERIYKIFKVSLETGEIESMKIRPIL